MKVSNKWFNFKDVIAKARCFHKSWKMTLGFLCLTVYMWFRGRTKIRGENFNKEVSSPISWHSLTGFCTWQGCFFLSFFCDCVSAACAVSLCHSLSSRLTVFSSNIRRRWNWKWSIKRIKAREKRREMETSRWRSKLKVGIWHGHTHDGLKVPNGVLWCRRLLNMCVDLSVFLLRGSRNRPL